MTNALDYLGNGIKASAKAKAAEILSRVSGANTITHCWGYDPNVSNTEHHSGLAVDFMVGNNKSLGDRIYSYLWANRSRLAVQHIIWQQHITSTVVSPGVRRAMADRGGPTANHMDHVHVLFFDRAYVAPSIVSKVKAKVSRKSKADPYLRNGSRGGSVRSLQLGLNRVFPAYSRLSVDGIFGPNTETVVREFQRRTGLSSDGVVGPNTRRKLRQYGIVL
jgi:hypothetical protein